jgi:hypothetical protein
VISYFLREIRIAFALAAVGAAAGAACADVLILTDGKAIEGEVVDRGEAYEVKTRYGILTIQKAEVKQVVKASAPPPVGPTPSPPAPVVNPKPAPDLPVPPPVSPGPSSRPDKPVSLQPAPPIKPAPPSSESQRQAEALIRSIFKADYAKPSPANLTALAQKLLQQGLETKDDPAARFVLFREARDLAAQAGNSDLSVQAVELMDQFYTIDPIAEKFTALLKAEVAARTPDATRALVDHYMHLMDDALSAGQYEVALRAGSRAEPLARAAKDPAMPARLRDRVKEIQELQREATTITGHLKTLAAAPEDSPANTAVGKFYCFVKGDWVKGLPMLAKGSDPVLKALAAKDLAKPAEVPDLIALADAWWDAGEKATGNAKSAHLSRAVHWYGAAAPKATGLTLAKINARTAAFEKMEASRSGTGGSAMPTAGLVFWLEPSRDPGDGFTELVSKGKPSRNNAKVVVEAGARAFSFATTCVEYPASDALKQMDATGSIFAWIKSGSYQHWGGIANRGGTGEKTDDFGLWVRQGHLYCWFNFPANPNPGPQPQSKGTLPTDRWVHAGVTWNDKTVTFYIDGLQDTVVSHPAPPMRRASVLAVGCNPPGAREYYLGFLGSLMIFNRQLPPPEAARLHAAGRTRFR